MHYCQECGIPLNSKEYSRWAWCGFYECYCSDHVWKANKEYRLFYCKMCGKGIAVSISNVNFGSNDSYCKQCEQESQKYMHMYIYGNEQEKERLPGILFKYDYITGKQINP